MQSFVQQMHYGVFYSYVRLKVKIEMNLSTLITTHTRTHAVVLVIYVYWASFFSNISYFYFFTGARDQKSALDRGVRCAGPQEQNPPNYSHLLEMLC